MKASAEVKLIFRGKEAVPSAWSIDVTVEPHTPIEHDILAAVAKHYEDDADGWDGEFKDGKLLVPFVYPLPVLRLVKAGGKGTNEEERNGFVLESDAKAADAEEKESSAT